MVPPAVTLAAITLCAALVVDRLVGDPHSRYHPVALLGTFIGMWGRPGYYPPRLQRAAGVLLWALTVFLFCLPFFLVSTCAPWYLYLLLAPFLLKCCFAWRSLEEHTQAVISALDEGVETGREKVRLLVSRDTADLDRGHILSAGYESMTENLNDSIIAPLFWFSLLNLPGAAACRAINTMDAMLGYRDERERLGWCAARMDDLVNFIPARITVLLLLIWFAARGTFSRSWQIMRRDGHLRPGFNGGIVIAAMAGGTGTRFEKPGVYSIGDGFRTLDEGGVEILKATRAVTLMYAIIACCTLLLLGALINNIGI
ncbi:MAG: adenosylcobinamide-phosphate synthase CbiB [Methanoregula sp.]|uniref:adenosylcobinamide-phosphate synthase CbiB n=1 Tax=Methanoregula sp. TaxID=2052170 RepID=UPI0025FB98E3|nr:adenosylcobinamide-phosphate synthase CbiB [Methanoregula sp.]MCK9631593.1 adenosylcobinamide-phosphate synthase CbiB [Methanoregula sp.]